jgi:hypothetical protein
MSRLLTALIALGVTFGLTAAIGQTLDAGPPKTSGEYKMAKETCKGPGEVPGGQCAKDAQVAEDNSRMQCEKLKDQAKRECVLEAFVQQHDRLIPRDRVEKNGGAPSGGPQPR